MGSFPALLFCQDFQLTIVPSNNEFVPVSYQGAYHIVPSGTSYTVSYSGLPSDHSTTPVDGNQDAEGNFTRDITSYSYQFLGYKWGSDPTFLNESELKAKLVAASADNTVSISAYYSETMVTMRYSCKKEENGSITQSPNGTEVSRESVNRASVNSMGFHFYKTPSLSAPQLNGGKSVVWESQGQASRSYTTEGGSSWSSDFYYQTNGGAKHNASGSTNSLSAALAISNNTNPTTIDFVLENVKCLAPDGTSDWTPSSVKNKKYSYNYTIWQTPSVEKESAFSGDITYVFNDSEFSLQPVLSGGDSEHWSFEWKSNLTGSSTQNSQSCEVSAANRFLGNNGSSMAYNTVTLTVKNTPIGIQGTPFSAELKYSFNSYPRPIVTLEENDFFGFSGESLNANLSVLMPNGNSIPTGIVHQNSALCNYKQNGSSHPLSGSISDGYSTSITSEIDNEAIKFHWEMQLKHNEGQYLPDYQFFEKDTTVYLSICKVPDTSDVDLSGSDSKALDSIGYVLNLSAKGKDMRKSGSWSYRWFNDSTTNNISYPLQSSDVNNITGNDYYESSFPLSATFTLNNKAKSTRTVQSSKSVAFYAIPKATQNATVITTCVGLSSGLGVSYTGGNPEDGAWSTEWYDESGNPLNEISGTNGNVTFNEDIVAERKDFTYHCVLKNKYNNRTWAEIPLSFDIQLYKRPEVVVSGLQNNNSYILVDLLSGDTQDVFATHNGGFPTESNWIFDWTLSDGLVLSNDNEIGRRVFAMKTLNPGEPMDLESCVLRVRNYYEDISNPWFDKTYYFTYNIWSEGISDQSNEAKASKSYLYGDDSSCDGKTWNSSIFKQGTLGGYDKGWTFDWSISDGSEFLTLSDESTANVAINEVSAKNVTSEIHQAKIILHAKNTFSGRSNGLFEIEYNVDVFPKATSSSPDAEAIKNINRYYGDQETVNVTSSGGDSDQWTFDLYKDGVLIESAPLSNTQMLFNSIQTPESTSKEGAISNSYKIIVENKHNGELWYSKEYPVNVTWWSKGIVEGAKNMISDVYGAPTICRGESHDDVRFEAKKDGGFDNGWKFRWVNESLAADVKTNSTSESVQFYDCNDNLNNSSTIREDKYRLYWSNAIDDSHIGNSGSIPFTVYVYPRTENPVEKPYTQRIRNIDIGEFSVSSGKYGDIWVYDWTDNSTSNINVVNSVQSSVIGSDIVNNSSKMLKKESSMNLHWSNNHNGVVWEEGDISYPYSVYNTPELPTLTKKGSGSSNIYIATGLSLSDQQLFSDEYAYNFAFGQGENNESVEAYRDTCRWYKYVSVPNSPWVYSVWHYSDGFDCQSDKVGVNGVKYAIGKVVESEDHSRTDTDIWSINANSLDLCGNHIVCTLQKPENVVVKIFSNEGALVKYKKYSKTCSFEDDLDVADLVKGIYFVTCQAGEIIINKKIVLY